MLMRNLCDQEVDQFRDRSCGAIDYYGGAGDEGHGRFLVPSPVDRQVLCIIASSSRGWDHVSVSRRNRPPCWAEMEHVKRLFFLPHETAMQLHVPVADHISVHPHCLHLWRPQEADIPRPPAEMVA